MQHGFRLGERRQFLERHEALHRDRAQVGDVKIGTRFERLDRGLIEPDPEAAGFACEPEKQIVDHAAERAGFIERKE